MMPLTQKPDRGTAFGAGWKARRDAALKRGLNDEKRAEIRAGRARYYAEQAAAIAANAVPEPAPETFDMRPEEERRADPRPAPAAEAKVAPEAKPARKGRKVETTDDGAILDE